MQPLSAERVRRAEQRFAIAVVGVYVVLGLSWIVLTDLVLYQVMRDRALVARFETVKGWLFVLLSAACLYPVLRRRATRLGRAQATLSAVVDSIADGVLLLGPDQTIAHANPAAARMLRTDPDDLIGMGAPEFSRRFHVSYPNGALVPPQEFVSQRVFREGGPLNYKAVLHPPGGEDVIISATAAAVRRMAHERAEVVVSVMHDITMFEQLANIRDQFFAAAAHSLKTPVTVIKANAQLAARNPGAPVARSIATIERQCRRMERLISNLIVLTRVRSGTLRLHATEVELGPLVEEAARDMTAASRQREVRAEVVAHPRVHADAERLSLALRNVIDGVVRASEDAAPIVVRVTQRGHDAEIHVRYHPHPEELWSTAFKECDDMGVTRHVTTTVVQAHGGALGEETAGPEACAWIRLPAIEDPHGS